MTGFTAAEIAENMGISAESAEESLQYLLDRGLIEMIDVDGVAKYRATLQGVLVDAILG